MFFLVEVDNLTSEDQLMYLVLSQSTSDKSFVDGLTKYVFGYSYFFSMVLVSGYFLAITGPIVEVKYRHRLSL